MARTLTRKEKRRLNKAKFRLTQRRKNLKRACVGKAKTKVSRRRKARSTKCRYHKARLPKNKAALKLARKSRRKPARKSKRTSARRTTSRRKSTSRRTRRNPETTRRELKGGGQIQLHREGANTGLVLGFDGRDKMILDFRGDYDKAYRIYKKIRNTSALKKYVEEMEWDLVGADNPRRGRGRKRVRRNCGRNPPIAKKDLAALRRVIATHARGRGRKFVR